MPSLSAIFGTLLPVFAVILLGAVSQRSGFLGEQFWPQAERLTYYVLFPALLLKSTATASLGAFSAGPLALALIGAILAMSILLMVLRPWVATGPAAFTSMFQGSIRFNTYIGLSAAFALFGQTGLNLGSMVIAVLIPLVNLLSVVVLLRHAPASQGSGWTALGLSLAGNPPILACVAGIILNVTGIGLSGMPGEFLGIVGRASLPIGLMAVGACMRLGDARESAPYLAGACLLKLILMPVLMAAACAVLGVEGLPRTVALLFAALPGSPVAFILARQLGGDFRLMASIVTVQVIISLFTLPMAMYLASWA